MQHIDFRHDLLPLKDKLFRLALRILSSRDEAEDIVQDTLLKVWLRRESLSEVENIEAFCLTACRNLSLDRLEKKETRNLSLETQEIDAEDRAPTPHQQLEADERRERIKQIFDSLPERQRTALQLCDIEEKSYREVADIMQTTEANVKVIIHRARQAVRKQYEAIDNYGL